MRKSAPLAILLLVAVAANVPVIAGTVFAVDGETQNIVKLDTATGTALGVIPTPEAASGGPDGLAASGPSLFFVNAIGSNLIHEVDAATGAGVDAYPAPLMAGGTDGLAYMDGFLYTLDSAADTIFRVETGSRQVAGSCSTGLWAVGGLAAEDGRLFATVGLTSIVELDPETCAVLGGPFASPGGDFLLGLAFDGTWLYASSYIGRTIFTLDPETGAVVDSFQPGFMASGLASTSAVASTTLSVSLDVRPDECANSLNVRSRGVVPVALLGGDGFDVGQIDLGTLRLEGVAPLRTDYRDWTRPGPCMGATPDGELDLAMHFDVEQLVAALEARHAPLDRGSSVTVQVEGRLLDGRLFTGEDTVSIQGQMDRGKAKGH
jgi:hypothetical protein